MSTKIFTVHDTNPMSWEEFDALVDTLKVDISSYCREHAVTIDAVCPILRNGAIPATMIANSLKIVPMLPVQVKCDYTVGRPVQLLPFAKSLSPDVGDSPTLVVVECNTFSGESARLAAAIIREAYPSATLFYVTVTQVYRKIPVDLSMFTHVFTGVCTNENFEATDAEATSLGLRPKVVIYPWETAEFEVADINATLGNQKYGMTHTTDVTIDTYNAVASDYAKKYFDDTSDFAYITEFISSAKNGGKVLDIGCGPGQLPSI